MRTATWITRFSAPGAVSEAGSPKLAQLVLARFLSGRPLRKTPRVSRAPLAPNVKTSVGVEVAVSARLSGGVGAVEIGAQHRRGEGADAVVGVVGDEIRVLKDVENVQLEFQPHGLSLGHPERFQERDVKVRQALGKTYVAGKVPIEELEVDWDA